MFVALEDAGERSAIVRRGGCRHLGTDVGELRVVAVDPEDDAAAVEDGVVGAADGAKLVLGYGRQRRRAEAGHDLAQVELQLVQLVQVRFQRAGHYLKSAGDAGRGRRQQRDLRRRQIERLA